MHPLAKLDHKHVWHPFTQMRDWLKQEPLIIAEGRGAVVRDVYGREYLDANSSIWTNLHGHNHPKVNAAIRRQLGKIAHSSCLGLANEPASLLAARLEKAANPEIEQSRLATSSPAPNLKTKRLTPVLSKVFFSDDGSTAMEVALKLAYEFARRSGRSKKPRFLGLTGAYHGDTVGAVSLGHIDLFHKTYAGLLFKSDSVAAPYCYRCPFNRAKPQRADARQYRKCGWECLDLVEQKFKTRKKKGEAYAGFVFEPLIQGAAGMIPQPTGWLARAAEIARSYGALLIADEVMTGFGRTGEDLSAFPVPPNERHIQSSMRAPGSLSLFACHKEQVQPDFLALAKGLTGGYLPMAATLTTRSVFEAFLGEYDEFKAFFHGHSFTGNQLGAAAALASLELLEGPDCIRKRRRLEQALARELPQLWRLPIVGDVRQVGLIAGVELVKDWRTREPFEAGQGVGIRVCEAMARRGVLTRPIGNVVVLMPPYCTTSAQLRHMVQALAEAVTEVAGGKASKSARFKIVGADVRSL
jgi:adenosylmethionine-8-amino-7-oxononanoate aminotransferase